MAYSDLRVPFGEKEGRLFAPNEVERGLKCGCVCPSCERPLIANKPTAKRDYFSHHRSAECPGGYETALHKMGKQIIEDAREVVIPGKTFNIRSHVADNHYLRESVLVPARSVKFSSVASEQRAERWTPDLTATLESGQIIYIEIKVTHEVEAPKAEALDNLMEIVLTDVSVDQVRDLQALKEIVLKTALRYWYRCSLLDDSQLVKQAQERLDACVPRERKQYYARIEEERKAAREKEQFEKRRAEQRRKYADHLARAERMDSPEAQRRFHLAMQEKAGDWIQKVQDRLADAGHAEPNAFPFGVGLRLQGDWIVRTYVLLWQTFVLERFVIDRPTGYSFTVQEVVRAVESQFGYIKWMKELADVKTANKRKGRERGAWYADSGAWFLTDEENKKIRTPYHLMCQYLDKLSEHPYSYLVPLKPGYKYVVRFNRPLERFHERIGLESDTRRRGVSNPLPDSVRGVMTLNALLSDIGLSKSQSETTEDQKQAEAAEDARITRNLRAAARLSEKNGSLVSLCTYCHILVNEQEPRVCSICGNGGFNKVLLTLGYLQSYPNRLMTMAKVWHKPMPKDD